MPYNIIYYNALLEPILEFEIERPMDAITLAKANDLWVVIHVLNNEKKIKMTIQRVDGKLVKQYP